MQWMFSNLIESVITWGFSPLFSLKLCSCRGIIECSRSCTACNFCCAGCPALLLCVSALWASTKLAISHASAIHASHETLWCIISLSHPACTNSCLMSFYTAIILNKHVYCCNLYLQLPIICCVRTFMFHKWIYVQYCIHNYFGLSVCVREHIIPEYGCSYQWPGLSCFKTHAHIYPTGVLRALRVLRVLMIQS